MASDSLRQKTEETPISQYNEQVRASDVQSLVTFTLEAYTGIQFFNDYETNEIFNRI